MIIAGFGLRAEASVDSLLDALAQAQASVSGSIQKVAVLAAPTDKCPHPALQTLSMRLNLPLISVGDAELRATETPTQADRVLAKRGTGSVAEAAALVAAGPAARLLTQRAISTDRMATCAIAEGELS